MKRNNIPQSFKHRSRTRIGALVAVLIAGTIGIILLNQTFACIDPVECPTEEDTPEVTLQPTDNPQLEQSCQLGLDVALLLDTSGSTNGTPREQAEQAMRDFINALEGYPMTFTIGTIDAPQTATEPTSDTAKALSDVATGTAGGGGSYLGDLQPILDKDTRPNKQNFIIALTDGQISAYDNTPIKAAGTRLLMIGVGNINLPTLTAISGPNVDTGSLWTSDVITSDFSKLGEELKNAASELCQAPIPTPGTGNNGTGNGNNGKGTGNNGKGTGKTGAGTGTDGTNKGKEGSGTGGGGTSATKQSDESQSIPKKSSQGTKKEDPPKVEPSPFFDGKEYTAGADQDENSQKDSNDAPATISQQWWVLPAAAVAGTGAVGGLGWFIWRRVRR